MEETIGLAMRRLAIIDVAGGNQPISNEEGTIWLTFNGEIYNFQELRADLEKSGHQFRTQSDTEVILHAYEKWGDDALLHLNGMFALALWDGKQKRLLLARDRMGEKPLYWHYSKEGLVWASEAKALLAVPWIERRVNPLAIHHYLTLQYVPNPQTIFEGIYQLPAAHKLILENRQDPKISRWWRLAFEPKWPFRGEELLERARELLRAAVRRRLISEVPLGAFLSGGIDSSIIVALMAEESSIPVKTFSIGFDEPYYSETSYARQVANRYGTDHQEFVFRSGDLLRVIEGVVSAMDEPFADPAALPLYELARQTRRHVTVALTGDGGDETMAGYNRYALDGLLRPYAALPSWITQRAVPAIVDWLPEPLHLPEDRNPLSGLKRLKQFCAVTDKASLVRWGSYFSHEEKLSLYTDHWREQFAPVDTAAIVSEAYDRVQAENRLDRTLGADHATYLAGDLLPKTDRVTMAHSLEARAPFLDVDWVEWTGRLLVGDKIRGLRTKWLLKAAFAKELPPAIHSRAKQGFGVPVGLWLRRELEDWARGHILHNPKMIDWFRPEGLLRLFEEHKGGRVNHGKRLWALLMLALWLEQGLTK